MDELKDKLLIGYISTSDKVIYGKNKSGKIIYSIKLLNKDYNMNNILITYGGTLKGKIIILFKINKIINNIYYGTTINIIGLMNNTNLLITLKYIYNVFRKNISINNTSINNTSINNYENNINRPIIDKLIFSIDPKNCLDIDDAISYEIFNDYYLISIYIAQPIYFLTEDLLIHTAKTSFSTLYNNNFENNNNLWGDTITFNSSFIQNELRNAYCIEFYIDNNFKIYKNNHYPCQIINKIQTNYDDCLNYNIIKEFYKFSILLDSSITDEHNLISYWMISTNNYIGNLDYSKKLNIPYRIIKEKYQSNEILDEYNNITNSKIKDVFLNKITNTSIYSNNDNINYHSILKVHNYIHMTSPIRRIIDTFIHWCITYNFDFNIFINKYNLSLDNINELNKLTNKYHKSIELLNNINKLFENNNNEEINSYGYIFKKSIDNNIWTIYTNELGFQKVKMWDKKIGTSNIINKLDNIKIGDKINIIIYKKNDFLPSDKILIISNI
jgi:hypothetical protein